MIKSVRLVIGIALVALIIIMGVYTYVNREKFFSNRVTIEYPDGCVEIYMNNEMVSPECTEGRRLVEESENKPLGTPYGVFP